MLRYLRSMLTGLINGRLSEVTWTEKLPKPNMKSSPLSTRSCTRYSLRRSWRNGTILKMVRIGRPLSRRRGVDGGAVKKATIDAGKVMSVKEVAERLGCHSETVKKHIRELFPAILRNGKTTYLTEAQATVVLEHMKRANEDTRNNTYNSRIAGAETTQSLYLQAALMERKAKEVETEAKNLWKQIA